MTKYIEIFSKQALDNLPESYAEKVAFYRSYLGKMNAGKPENLFELIGAYGEFKLVEQEFLKKINEQNLDLYGLFCEENKQKILNMRVELNKTLARKTTK